MKKIIVSIVTIGFVFLFACYEVNPVITISTTGSATPNFYDLACATVDSNNNIIANDNNGIYFYDKTGKPFYSIPSGSYFNLPFDFTINKTTQQIFVSDPVNNAIAVFNWNGQTATFSKKLTLSDEYSQTLKPFALVFNNENELIVTSMSGTRRVHIYTASGTLLRSFGPQGTSAAYNLSVPGDVTVDSTDRIIVSDMELDKIVIYDENGALINSFGKYGIDEGQFYEPDGVAVNAKNDIIVADTMNHRIQIFTSAGDVSQVMGTNDPNATNNLFEHPHGVVVDLTGRLIVANRLYDNTQGNILVFNEYSSGSSVSKTTKK